MRKCASLVYLYIYIYNHPVVYLYIYHHPDHIKKNIPYNLAKRIVVFCSNFSTEKKRLLELKGWLLNCNYPLSVIEKGFRDARLQGPAPDPNLKKASLPLVTTYFSNFDSKNIAIKCERLLSESGNDRIKEVFGNQKTVLALRQPKNLLRHLTKSEFSSNTAMNTEKPPGLFCCNRSNCNLCKLYIQECSSFKTSNNYNWTIKCHINCHSKLVVYYLKCICCNLETYIGKTNNFRARMNNHISESRSGSTSNIFDRHVYNCRKKQKLDKEPFFHIYAFMTVSKEELLIPYESHLQERNFDTMNSWNLKSADLVMTCFAHYSCSILPTLSDLELPQFNLDMNSTNPVYCQLKILPTLSDLELPQFNLDMNSTNPVYCQLDLLPSTTQWRDRLCTLSIATRLLIVNYYSENTPV